MPECRKCHRVGPSCDLRRTTLGHTCKETVDCGRIVKAVLKARKASEVKTVETQKEI